MKHVDQEFAYQSRELAAQIEDTLGEPPDRKHYARVVKSLVTEYANGSDFEDVNLLSFALADYLTFDQPAALLAQAKQYEFGDAENILSMVSCDDPEASIALEVVFERDPELLRKAIVTAFLFKNKQRWTDEDHSLESLEKEGDQDDDEDEDQMTPGHNIDHLFDTRGDENV
jgi:hypothetical protein